MTLPMIPLASVRSKPFLAGLILAGAFQRTGNLFVAIGIHAGWIIALKTNSFISSPVNTPVFWGDNKPSDGWVATPLLAAMAWYIYAMIHSPLSQWINSTLAIAYPERCQLCEQHFASPRRVMCVGRAKNYFDGQSRLGAPSAAFLLTQVSLPFCVP